MTRIKAFFFMLLYSCEVFSVASKDQLVLKIAAIDWCPQICPNEKPKGYVVDFVLEAYKKFPVTIQIDYFPWSRAIKNVNEGKYDALLSPAKKEAPHLRYPSSAIGSQQMCFFVLNDNSWRYSGSKSLKNLQIGIAKDTSVEELNEYVLHNPQQFQFQPYLDRYVEQNFGKLKKGRIDTFLFTKNTTLWDLQKLAVSKQAKIAGCVSRAPIYIAFTPLETSKDKINLLISQYERGIADLEKSGKHAEILARYHLQESTLRLTH